MLEKLEELAELSVGRACGFAAIGILTLMLGLSDQMRLSLKVGGLMGLALSLILVARALTVVRKPYKRTELWVMLKPEERPSEAVAQQLISATLRQAYFHYALNAASIAAGFLLSSLILSIFG